MKRSIFILAAGIVMAQRGLAQTGNVSQWVGVWEGQRDGQPGVTVTLGRDTGELQRTMVFNVVTRENGQACVIGHDAHVLTHVNLNDGVLAF